MVRVVCVVDNQAKEGTGLKAEHGVAFWIETPAGNVLFDTGQSEGVLSHNLATLGLRLDAIDALALSHAHYDHTGGLGLLMAAGKRIPLFAHPDLFRLRFSLRKGEYKTIGLRYPEAELAGCFDLQLGDSPLEILPGVWTTGEIKNRTERVGGSDSHLIQGAGGWEADPYKDDLSLVVKTQDGLALICGCCHAGILNTIQHVERVFGDPICAVIGGMHLGSADDAYLQHVIDILQEKLPECRFYPNHCTGGNAMNLLSEALMGRFSGCPAGTKIEFQDPVNRLVSRAAS